MNKIYKIIKCIHIRGQLKQNIRMKDYNHMYDIASCLYKEKYHFKECSQKQSRIEEAKE